MGHGGRNPMKTSTYNNKRGCMDVSEIGRFYTGFTFSGNRRALVELTGVRWYWCMQAKDVPAALRSGNRPIVSIPPRARITSQYATKSKIAAEGPRKRLRLRSPTQPEGKAHEAGTGDGAQRSKDGQQLGFFGRQIW